MIKSFKNKGLEAFYIRGEKRWIQAKHLQKISDVLDLLDAAIEISDMDFPGSKLHPLKGQYKGFWSIAVSGNWRLIFQFKNGDASLVDYLDYH